MRMGAVATRQRNVWFGKWWTWNYGRKVTGDGWNVSAYATPFNKNQNVNRAPIWPVRAPAALRILPNVADKAPLSGSLRFT